MDTVAELFTGDIIAFPTSELLLKGFDRFLQLTLERSRTDFVLAIGKIENTDILPPAGVEEWTLRLFCEKERKELQTRKINWMVNAFLTMPASKTEEINWKMVLHRTVEALKVKDATEIFYDPSEVTELIRHLTTMNDPDEADDDAIRLAQEYFRLSSSPFAAAAASGASGKLMSARPDGVRFRRIRDIEIGKELQTARRPSTFSLRDSDDVTLPDMSSWREYVRVLVKVGSKASPQFKRANAEYLSAWASVAEARSEMMLGLRLKFVCIMTCYATDATLSIRSKDMSQSISDRLVVASCENIVDPNESGFESLCPVGFDADVKEFTKCQEEFVSVITRLHQALVHLCRTTTSSAADWALVHVEFVREFYSRSDDCCYRHCDSVSELCDTVRTMLADSLLECLRSVYDPCVAVFLEQLSQPDLISKISKMSFSKDVGMVVRGFRWRDSESTRAFSGAGREWWVDGWVGRCGAVVGGRWGPGLGGFYIFFNTFSSDGFR